MSMYFSQFEYTPRSTKCLITEAPTPTHPATITPTPTQKTPWTCYKNLLNVIPLPWASGNSVVIQCAWNLDPLHTGMPLE